MSQELPWYSLKNQTRGLILFRLRLKGGFNLVSRLFRERPENENYRGSNFLEGIIDTKLGLDWGEDVDVRQKLPTESVVCFTHFPEFITLEEHLLKQKAADGETKRNQRLMIV